MHKPLRTFFVLALVVLGGSLSAAAQRSQATTPPPPATSQILEAYSFTTQLLNLGSSDLAAQASSSFQGFFPAWKTAYPWLGGSGTAIEATPTSLSIYYNLLSPKNLDGPENPRVILFTTRDTNGKCSVGAFYGYPKTDKTFSTPLTGTCNAQNGIEEFRKYLLATSPSPVTVTITPTTRAPGPPNTGTGTGPDSRGTWPIVAAGIGVLLTALAATAVTRRQP
ncbi:hypothetical protein AYO38_06605 [bacterium SCGC AG-212-C10]|nr:hypothetical protein AYO38_06605 [bacterium SCGC AG-212-C10]